MNIDVYNLQGLPDGTMRSLLVPSGTQLSSLPDNVLNLLVAKNSKPKKQIAFQQGDKRIGLDSDEALAKINCDGYYIETSRFDMKISK